MIDHVSIGVRAIATTKTFYDAALKPVGYSCLSPSEGSLGYGKEHVLGQRQRKSGSGPSALRVA